MFLLGVPVVFFSVCLQLVRLFLPVSFGFLKRKRYLHSVKRVTLALDTVFPLCRYGGCRIGAKFKAKRLKNCSCVKPSIPSVIMGT